MDGETDQIIPRARERGLIVRELEEETIVYELETDRAHCLNPISATVWKHCDGRTTVSDMVDILCATQQAPVGEDTVWQAVMQLAQYDLLEEQVSRPTRGAMSRREWMKRTGLTAAVAFPLITSLAVPSAAMAASNCSSTVAGTRSNGCPCPNGSYCASACCLNGTCQSPASVGKIPDGGLFCSGNGNCCSNNCHVTAGQNHSGVCMQA
jgi:Coenzyme PQQ synthesis protein D (PqqD)